MRTARSAAGTRAGRTRVVLVHPRLRLPTGDPPLGLAYVASALSASGRAEVRIADGTFRRSRGSLVRAIAAHRPDVVGIYADTLMSDGAVAVARAAKRLGAFVVMGGPHATVRPESRAGCSDAVVVGEGERAMVEIVERYRDRALGEVEGIWFRDRAGEMVRTPPRKKLAELDALPFPALDLLDMRSYLARWHYLDCVDVGLRGTNLVGSRGCPFQCSFCQPCLKLLFGSATRHRSPENVVDELRLLRSRYGISSFFFHDDTLTVDRNRVLALCDAIRRSGLDVAWGCNSRVDTLDRETLKAMRAAGLRKLHVGAESGSQRILDDVYGKAIRVEQVRELTANAADLGVHCLAFFILGAPGETREELRRTIDLACSLPVDEATFSILAPLPGSAIRERLARDPRCALSDDPADYNYYSRRAFRDPALSGAAVKLHQLEALLRFYLGARRRRYLRRHLTSVTGVRKLLRKVARSL
jgi:anaerobic magnesium-protoporphyrin IX monomethyl ester cyclase